MAQDQLWLNAPYARSEVVSITDLTAEEIRQAGVPQLGKVRRDTFQALCLYRESPTTIALQLRTATRSQGRITRLSLTASEARQVAEFLLRKAEELEAVAAAQER